MQAFPLFGLLQLGAIADEQCKCRKAVAHVAEDLRRQRDRAHRHEPQVADLVDRAAVGAELRARKLDDL